MHTTAASSSLSGYCLLIHLALLLFSFFTTYIFVGIANTFTLVGLGWAIGTNLSRYLAYLLLINATDYYFGLAWGCCLNAIRQGCIRPGVRNQAAA